MPITQERLINLISIADEHNIAQQRIRDFISNEAKLATQEYHESQDLAYLSSTLLGRIQAIESVINEPYLSPNSIIILATEKEHFRLTRHKNNRAKDKAKRKRNNNNNPNINFEQEERY